MSEIVAGDLDMCVMVASPDGDHVHEMRYQKHLFSAKHPLVEWSFFSKSCAILVVFWIRACRMLVVFCVWSFSCVMSLVVIWEVSSTNASPSRFIIFLIGVFSIKLSYLSDTDQSIVSKIAFHMLGALPLPCPTPSILFCGVDWYALAAVPCPVLRRYSVL